MNTRRILILMALPIIIFMGVFSYGQYRGTELAQAERYQLVLAVACLNPNFDAALDNLNVPEDWGLHEIMVQNPEIYQALVEDIVSECTNTTKLR